MELFPESIDHVFAVHSHQADVFVGLHKLIYNGSAEDRPPWDLIKKLEGYPVMGKALSQYIWEKFLAFDKIHHPEVYTGGLWFNSGWATEKSMEEWAVEPAPVTLLTEEELKCEA